MPYGRKVCVTGANGYLGAHIVQQLLEKDYKVNGTVRDATNSIATRELQSLSGASDNLELFSVELRSDKAIGLSKALAGCDAVIHTAHAGPGVDRFRGSMSTQDVHASVFGTLSLLQACKASGVKTVVITSCMAAAMPASTPSQRTETDWSEPQHQLKSAGRYGASKTLAEIAAWKFVESENTKIRLVTILPACIVGPVVGKPGAPERALALVLDWATRGYCPEDCASFIDVRDCAAHHVAAVENPKAKGRFFSTSAGWSWTDLIPILEAGNEPDLARWCASHSGAATVKFDFTRQASLGVITLSKAELIDNVVRSLREQGLEPLTSIGHGTEDMHFEVQRASYEVKGKRLLNDVSVSLSGGEVLAVMGPREGGRKTMLDYMSLGLAGFRASGEIMMNGTPFTREVFADHAAFVEKHDRHWAYLTCREVIEYSARLYMSGDADERERRVEDILAQCGLLDCQNNYVNNVVFTSLSRGQKKLLSLGAVLMKSPSIFFLDEPTDGIDAASIKRVCQLVQKIARETHAIIVASVDKAPIDVLMTFSQIMMLTGGRLAYLQPPGDLARRCKSIGRPVPKQMNPADHFIDLIDDEVADRASIDEIVGTFQPSPASSGKGQGLPQRMRAGVVSNTCTLVHRQIKLSFRDPLLYAGRTALFLLTGVFIGCVYIKAKDLEQKHIHARLHLANWLIGVPTLLSILAVVPACEEFKIVRKELRNGMGGILPFWIAKTIVTIPFMALLSSAAIILPGYCMFTFPADQLPATLVVVAATLWAFECVAEEQAVTFEYPLIGVVGAVVIWFLSNFFSCLYMPLDEIDYPFRVFAYLMPGRGAIKSIMYLNLHSEDNVKGAVSTAFPVNGNYYICPGEEPQECWGTNGKEILDSMHQLYDVVEDDKLWVRDTMWILTFAAVFKIIALLKLWAFSRRS